MYLGYITLAAHLSTKTHQQEFPLWTVLHSALQCGGWGVQSKDPNFSPTFEFKSINQIIFSFIF